MWHNGQLLGFSLRYFFRSILLARIVKADKQTTSATISQTVDPTSKIPRLFHIVLTCWNLYDICKYCLSLVQFGHWSLRQHFYDAMKLLEQEVLWMVPALDTLCHVQIGQCCMEVLQLVSQYHDDWCCCAAAVLGQGGKYVKNRLRRRLRYEERHRRMIPWFFQYIMYAAYACWTGHSWRLTSQVTFRSWSSWRLAPLMWLMSQANFIELCFNDFSSICSLHHKSQSRPTNTDDF